MAIGLLRAHPSEKILPLKQQQATLDPDFRLRLLPHFHAQALAGGGTPVISPVACPTGKVYVS